MNVSESWLREWVNPSITTAEMVEQLTMAGLEVDSVEPAAGDFSGVVVGQIVSVAAHPDADKLRVCQVAGAGVDGLTQVVCGAPNAREGIKVPFATVGAVLPGNFKIKKAKLRGVESFGMLCAQTELQAGDDDDGLWELSDDANVGQDIREYLSLNDSIIEVDLTPNRGDCLSVKGLARDVAVLNSIDVNTPSIDPVSPTIDETRDIVLSAPDACPKYVGRVIRSVNISAPSPLWLKEKLRRSGIRSIDAVVDVTNFILLELGQPMHAFDHAKLSGSIRVRMANDAEPLVVLGGQQVKLTPNTLVISDDSGAIAMAGIMGGEATAVSSSTSDLFLEAAFFQPIAIAGRARSYGLHTDSSHRFERGVDYAGANDAIERATRLLLDIVGGEAGPVIHVENQDAMPKQKHVFLSRSRILSCLGLVIDDSHVLAIMKRLGLSLSNETPEGWSFLIPSYRFDIAIEADLLEELARIYGYNNLPIRTLQIPAKLPVVSETLITLDVLRSHIVARDYQEVITYSFIDPKVQAVFAEGLKPVELLNPISADMSVMRTTLLPGLVGVLKNNLNRQKTRVRLFESGLRFMPSPCANTDKIKQISTFAGLIYGAREAEAWDSQKNAVDFYDLKGDIESLLDRPGRNVEFSSCDSLTYMHPGQTATVLIEGEPVGYCGAIHPETQRALGLNKAVFVFEFDCEKIQRSTVAQCQPISKFPAVARDIALIVEKAVEVKSLKASIRAAAGENLKSLTVFDVYVGDAIGENRKSVAINLTFQNSSRTLNEVEITSSIASVVKCLEDEFNAELRQ